jgi:hypothetical protein
MAKLANCNATEQSGTAKAVVAPVGLSFTIERWFWVQVPVGVKTEKPL